MKVEKTSWAEPVFGRIDQRNEGIRKALPTVVSPVVGTDGRWEIERSGVSARVHPASTVHAQRGRRVEAASTEIARVEHLGIDDERSALVAIPAQRSRSSSYRAADIDRSRCDVFHPRRLPRRPGRAARPGRARYRQRAIQPCPAVARTLRGRTCGRLTGQRLPRARSRIRSCRPRSARARRRLDRRPS